MSTLGIYGDSFADDRHWYEDVLTASAWSYLLGQDYRSYENYARDGSSLYYSYKNFMDTHSKWDKIVFCVTFPGRWPGELQWLGRNVFINSPTRVEDVLADKNLKLNVEQRAQIEALRSYFLHTRVYKYDTDMHDLMIADIRRTRPDALILDVMVRHTVNNRNREPASLSDFRAITPRTLAPQFVHSGDRARDIFNRLTDNGWIESPGSQICHMPSEINLLVYDAIKKALDSGIWQPNIPDTYPHHHAWEYYYTRR